MKTSSGVTHFAAHDGNGNVVGLVDSTTGSTSAQYEYGPFGEMIRASGTLSSNPFRFSTKYTDDESDFVYYGYRYYNPSTGRWLNRDPVGESGFELLWKYEQDIIGDIPSLYVFVANNPLTWIDLLGLKRRLKPEERKKIGALITAIRECAQRFGDREVINAINALDIRGIFDRRDVEKDPSLQDDSETTFGFWWLESDTWLAADFFQNNKVWDDKVRAEVLIHEAWHAWKKKVQEENASKFGSDKCDKLWNCIKQKLGISRE